MCTRPTWPAALGWWCNHRGRTGHTPDRATSARTGARTEKENVPMNPALELGDLARRSDNGTAAVAADSPPPAVDGLAAETRGLGKTFGSRAALHNVDLKVPRSCAFGFLGPNGAGKTTLIRLLLGLAEPTAGRMRLLGHDLPGGATAALARVGAVIEEPRFHPHLTGREDLGVHAAARERAAYGRIDGALARVGLAARADDRVKTYSLGVR